MLHRAKELRGDAIVADDGAIGSVDDLYFDDERWGLRYFVVDTGSWLPGRWSLRAITHPLDRSNWVQHKPGGRVAGKGEGPLRV